MYFPDLSPYEHCWPGEYEAAYCGLPVRNVGWLSFDYPFTTGDAPEDLSERLLHLCATQLLQNPSLHLMGFHTCEFCLDPQPAVRVEVPGRGWISLGSDEIRVVGRDYAYAAPNLIYHYVTEHRYQPPDDFIAAVLEPPASQSRALEMYAYHLWEASLNPRTLFSGDVLTATRAFLEYAPGSLAGTTLGRLVRRYRLAQGAVLTGLALMVLLSKPSAALFGLSWQPGLTAGFLLGFVLLLAGAYWAEHLPCPLCGAALKPARSPEASKRRPQWHDRLHFTEWLYCDSAHFAISYRLSPFPWSAPPCHVGYP